MGASSENLAAWQGGAQEKLSLKVSDAPWLSDESLLNFFQNEASAYHDQERLSACHGNGMWLGG
jgi:hypothetical protein